MDAYEYNIEYFKLIRDEITKRIEIHYKLVMTKFTIIGAVFAFLLKMPSPIAVSPFLVPSICAFLADILILGNLGWIRSAGNYVKQNIENDDDRTINWEHDFAQSGGNWACFTAKGYRFGVWSIGFLMTICGIIYMIYLGMHDKPINPIDILILVIAVYLLGYTNMLINENLSANSPPMLSNSRPSPIDMNLIDDSKKTEQNK